jgi:RHS repeat-associated protein
MISPRHGAKCATYWTSGALKTVTLTTPGTPQVVSSYTYDALVRPKTMTDSSSGTWTYGYDLNDNRTLEDDPTAGRSLQMTYNDPLNRMTSRTELGSRDGRSTTFEYDGRVPFGPGRPYRVTRSQTTGTFTSQTTYGEYDARGNVKQATQRIQAGSSTVRSYLTTKTYDPVGRLRTTTLPAPDGGETLVYGYAPAGEVAAIASNRNASYVTDVRYDERGRVTDLAYGNGVTDTFTYHTPEGRDPGGGGGVRAGYGDTLAQVTSGLPAPAPLLRQLDYTIYNPNGQLTRVMDGAAIFQDAVYDDAARLVQWSAAGVSARTYTYDGLGRLTNKEGKPYTYSTTQPFHIATYDNGAVTYDGNGNVKQLPGTKTFDYDAEGNLVKATVSGSLTQYFADDAGIRRVTIGPTGDKTFFFDDFDADITSGVLRRHIRLNGRLVATSTVTGSGLLQTARLTPADLRRLEGITGTVALVLVGVCLAVPGRVRRGRRRLGRRGPATVAVLLVVAQWPTAACAQCVPPPPFAETRIYYHLDHLASAQLLTDAAGNPIESTKFFPYGSVAERRNGSGTLISDTQGQFAFTGHRTTESDGLAYFGARYYAPELAVFASRDPAGQFPNPLQLRGRQPAQSTRPQRAVVLERTRGPWLPGGARLP